MKAESYDMYVLRIKIKHERSSLIVTQTGADTGFWVEQDAKVFMAREARENILGAPPQIGKYV